MDYSTIREQLLSIETDSGRPADARRIARDARQEIEGSQKVLNTAAKRLRDAEKKRASALDAAKSKYGVGNQYDAVRRDVSASATTAKREHDTALAVFAKAKKSAEQTLEAWL